LVCLKQTFILNFVPGSDSWEMIIKDKPILLLPSLETCYIPICNCYIFSLIFLLLVVKVKFIDSGQT
jgi:hypothetical protein